MSNPLAGGAALPVSVDANAAQEAGAAVPVYVAAPGSARMGGPARRIVVVTSGPVAGGPAIPVYEAASDVAVLGGPALPVFVVGGSLGVNAALIYTNKVKALSPLAYWPLAESSGSVANDESGNGRDGLYVNGPVLGGAGIGDGRLSPTFDGSNDCVNIYGASLAAAFNKDEGTFAAWVKVSAAGVWSDATARRVTFLQADSSNRAYLTKTSTANQLEFNYTAGGTAKSVLTTAAAGSTLWLHVAMTWSKAADQLKAYIGGAQVGATQTGLGTWVGALGATTTVVGAINSSGTGSWSGQLAHPAVWSRALSAAEIAILAVVA